LKNKIVKINLKKNNNNANKEGKSQKKIKNIEKEIIYECKELDLKIKYYKKINKTNFIYYKCSKRRYRCNGTCKYNKKEKKFYMTQVCVKKK